VSLSSLELGFAIGGGATRGAPRENPWVPRSWEEEEGEYEIGEAEGEGSGEIFW